MDHLRRPFTALAPKTGLFAMVLLAGCGGGGSSTPPPLPDPVGWEAGVFEPSENYSALCSAPRSGLDPDTALPYPDSQGTSTDENNWLRAWSDETYLWYDEIVDRDPALFTTTAYFDLLKSPATTASGQPRDRFHFALPTEEWRELSTTGASAGYGAEWVLLSAVPPRELVVVHTEPVSPAASPTANLLRGARILEVDGIDLVNADDAASVAILNAGIYPEGANETHEFTVQDPGATGTRTISMTSAIVQRDPVPVVDWFDTATGRVGYLLFTGHIGTAETALIDAVETLDTAGVDNAGVDDLILDLRYNGGGYLFIASELAYMIAGQTATAGRTFELQQFSDKHPDVNPVTGSPLDPVPFFASAVGIVDPIAGTPLPTLDLPRVFVLTGPDTCSASESIINALDGIGIEVIQIGSTTCGKPYGFYPTDNCGTTYFTIQFQGINNAGFGDYSDGFSPANSTDPASTFLNGCAVADDYDHALGDISEGRIAAALNYRDFASCPAPSSFNPDAVLKTDTSSHSAPPRLLRRPWETIRW